MKKAGNKPDAETILHVFHLKKTKPRLAVLSILDSKDMAIAYPALAKKMKNTNRATLYGVLLSLEAKGVVYKIFDLRGVAHYALCSFDQSRTKPHFYLHFNCSACKKIYCLNEPDLPPTLLAEGFHAVRFTLCINGICPKCHKKGLLSNKIQ